MIVDVIGAGFAGVEAANALSLFGYDVNLFEMKPKKFSPAHKSSSFAELVCSNSFKAARLNSAAGLLKAEARLLGSLVLPIADITKVTAGGALAVNRDDFSFLVTESIKKNSRITVINEEKIDIDSTRPTVIATGPLTEGSLANSLQSLTGGFLNFYDAAAPIVTAESIDMTRVFLLNRYDFETEGDYINCFFDKDSYEKFREELVNAKVASLHEGLEDETVYEGCMPIERLAKRGMDTMRFGPLKPVGLKDPTTGRRPYAAVQLRKEDNEGRLYNIVGFQTNLSFSEQKRVFSKIPGLENVEFARFGVMHRNSFLNSPRVLNSTLNLKEHKNIYIAGQLTGFEGYIESATSGLLAARFLHRALQNEEARIPSEYTMCGALLRYITRENKDFQPMGANMGLLPPLESSIKDKKEKYMALATRAIKEMESYFI